MRLLSYFKPESKPQDDKPTTSAGPHGHLSEDFGGQGVGFGCRVRALRCGLEGEVSAWDLGYLD